MTTKAEAPGYVIDVWPRPGKPEPPEHVRSWLVMAGSEATLLVAESTLMGIGLSDQHDGGVTCFVVTRREDDGTFTVVDSHQQRGGVVRAKTRAFLARYHLSARELPIGWYFTRTVEP